MPAKSKLLIIIIPVAIFISAFIWKQNTVDNSEEIHIPVVKTVKPYVKPKRLDNSVEIDLSEEVSNEEQHKINIKNYETRMNLSLMLNTPEKAMENIRMLLDRGMDDKANEVIDYLLETFPDYEMPQL